MASLRAMVHALSHASIGAFLLLGLALAGCDAPEAADVVPVPPTVAFTLQATAEGGFEAVYDLANPNVFPITVEALYVGVEAGGVADARCLPLGGDGCDGIGPDWPADAALIGEATPPAPLTLAARETTECHAALEGCVVRGDAFCCDNGLPCRPLGDCIGKVTPEGSRCLVCPTHVEVRVPLILDTPPDASRGAARFTAPELGDSLIEGPSGQ